ncbi:hypothetical protein KBD18_01595 [Patescibacteria group bacterium]|nr:hypothetical protein [Patescibacteria group bacterium]
MKLLSTSKKIFTALLTDRSVLSLLLANGVTIFFAMRELWSIDVVLWVFWFQNILIGFFHFLRMRRVQNFYFSDPNAHFDTSTETRSAFAIFFLIHFGFFQLIYLLFLRDRALVSSDALLWRSVGIAVAGFLINHTLSFFQNTNLYTRRQEMTKLLFLPYARIIPMHFFALVGGFFLSASSFRIPLLFFLLLKTVADVVAHGAQTALGDIVPKRKTT